MLANEKSVLQGRPSVVPWGNPITMLLSSELQNNSKLEMNGTDAPASKAAPATEDKLRTTVVDLRESLVITRIC